MMADNWFDVADNLLMLGQAAIMVANIGSDVGNIESIVANIHLNVLNFLSVLCQHEAWVHDSEPVFCQREAEAHDNRFAFCQHGEKVHDKQQDVDDFKPVFYNKKCDVYDDGLYSGPLKKCLDQHRPDGSYVCLITRATARSIKTIGYLILFIASVFIYCKQIRQQSRTLVFELGGRHKDHYFLNHERSPHIRSKNQNP